MYTFFIELEISVRLSGESARNKCVRASNPWNEVVRKKDFIRRLWSFWRQ